MNVSTLQRFHHPKCLIALETLASDVNAVHPVDEIIFIIEHHIQSISICAEMPAITNMIYTAFHKGKA